VIRLLTIGKCVFHIIWQTFLLLYGSHWICSHIINLKSGFLATIITIFLFFSICFNIIYNISIVKNEKFSPYHPGGIKLKFKEFKKFYYLNPDRYCLNSCANTIQDRNMDDIEIYFSRLDTIKLYYWKFILNKNNNELNIVRLKQKYIQSIKDEIMIEESLAEEDINKSKEILEEIQLRF